MLENIYLYWMKKACYLPWEYVNKQNAMRWIVLSKSSYFLITTIGGVQA